jgi:hypothetical protein
MSSLVNKGSKTVQNGYLFPVKQGTVFGQSHGSLVPKVHYLWPETPNSLYSALLLSGSFQTDSLLSDTASKQETVLHLNSFFLK